MSDTDLGAEAIDRREWPEWRRPSHPILVAAAALALTVGAWHGLIWELERSPEDEATAESTALASSDTGHDRVLGRASESVSAGTPALARPTEKPPTASPMTPAQGPVGRTPAPSNRELAPANQPQPPADPSPRPSDRSPPQSKVTPADRPRPAAEPTQHAAEATETPENATVDPNVSPFRRSHPWAAVPGQPYYYPTRCPATLRFPDLIFFRTQAQARANGYVQAPDSGCGGRLDG
jgi:hypothetical protein